MPTITEIRAKRILTKTKIPGADYVVNQYSGCSFTCSYCYARFVCRWRKGKEKWGEFVDVKVNAAELLEKEIHGKKGRVIMSTISDPYQPVELKYRLTRRILDVLSNSDLKTEILTKSPLVAQDLKYLLEANAEVGFSIGTLKKNPFELSAPHPLARAEALKTLHSEGARTYLFIGPIIPGLTDLDFIFSELSEYADRILLEDLNLSPNKREMLEIAEKAGLKSQILSANRDYWLSMKERATQLGKDYGIPVEVYFKHTGDLRF